MLVFDDEAEVGLFELVISHSGEFVKAFFVGFVSFGVVTVDFEFIQIENSFSVGVFKC